MTLVKELPLKLTRKCLESFGQSAVDTEVNRHAISKWIIMSKIDILSPHDIGEGVAPQVDEEMSGIVWSVGRGHRGQQARHQ